MQEGMQEGMQEEARKRAAGEIEETGPFKAFRVTFYPTHADRAAKTNGTARYALTQREIGGTRTRGQTGGGAVPPEVVEVTLKAGHFRVRTPEGNCGITDADGIIGLDKAIQRGIAVIRELWGYRELR